MKLKKGSKEAKAFMAKIRAAKGKPKKKVSGWNKGGTYIIESGESKPAKAKKVLKVTRRKVVKPGTFKDFTRIGYTHKDTKSHNVNIRVLSGYKQTPEIILGKVGSLSLLKSLAPEVKIRITRGKKVKNNQLTNAKEAVEILKKFLTPAKIQTQEYALAIFVNNNSNVLAVYQFGMGGFTATIMDKRLLMAAGLKLGATGIILCHNHPSGSLNPSKADLSITAHIKDVAKIHDINVLDHIIITKDGYYSFAENGVL